MTKHSVSFDQPSEVKLAATMQAAQQKKDGEPTSKGKKSQQKSVLGRLRKRIARFLRPSRAKKQVKMREEAAEKHPAKKERAAPKTEDLRETVKLLRSELSYSNEKKARLESIVKERDSAINM